MTSQNNIKKYWSIVNVAMPSLIWVALAWFQSACLGVPVLKVKDCLPDLSIEAPLVASDPQPTLDELLNIVPRTQQPLDIEGHLPEAVEKKINDRLSGIEVSGEFAMALHDMEQASSELSDRLNPGVTTQRLQEAAMSKLEALIAEAKRQWKAGASGSNGQHDARGRDDGTMANAARRPAVRGQQARQNLGGFSPGAVGPVRPNLEPLAETGEQWGNLPPRLREQLIQGMGERFSLIYRSLTEAYYRRLAEEAEP